MALLLVWAMHYPAQGGLTVGDRARPDRRVLVHPGDHRTRAGHPDDGATNALVAASMASIVLNPLAYRAIRPIERWIAQRPRWRALLNRAPSVPADPAAPRVARGADPRHRAVVIGFGPTGRTVVRLLRDNGISPTVVDLNMDAVRALKQDAIDAIYGDATRPETLEAAGVAGAGSLILGSAGMANSAEVIRSRPRDEPSRAGACTSVIPARCRVTEGCRRGPGLFRRRRGCPGVSSRTFSMTLARPPEQIDRERSRAHEELSSVHNGAVREHSR